MYPPPKALGLLSERVQEDCKREEQWMTTRKRCLPDTTEQLKLDQTQLGEVGQDIPPVGLLALDIQ